MNITTIAMAKVDALELYREYRRAVLAQPNPTDAALMRGYKALAKGRTVLDLADVMRTAGVDEKGRPKLAIVRADATEVYCRTWSEGSAQFTMEQWPRYRASRRMVSIPRGTFTIPPGSGASCRAVVPLIPPRHRPRFAPSNYHILWEAEWQDVPRDPLLLRRLGGMLFAVLAQWDLTELERSVLRGR